MFILRWSWNTINMNSMDNGPPTVSKFQEHVMEIWWLSLLDYARILIFFYEIMVVVFFVQNLFLLDKMEKNWMKPVLSSFFRPKLSKTGRNDGQFGQNGHFAQLHFNRSRAKHKPLLITMLLKYPNAQTLIAQAMGHFSFAEMPSVN